MFDTKSVTTKATLDTTEEGRLKAVISVFDVPDLDGDIVVKSAFTDGQEVPMVWGHDWKRPIGKGVIRVTDEKAIFDGRLFLDTRDGLDAYRTVKAMGDLQEYSVGFQILDAEPVEMDGQQYQRITKWNVFEASPVLVGANRLTHTLAIKGHDLSFEDHSERVRDAVAEYLSRLQAGTARNVKEGRPISEARRKRMVTVLGQLRDAADEIDAMLKETEPAPRQAVAPTDAKEAPAVTVSAVPAELAALLALRDDFTKTLTLYDDLAGLVAG